MGEMIIPFGARGPTTARRFGRGAKLRRGDVGEVLVSPHAEHRRTCAFTLCSETAQSGVLRAIPVG